MSANRRADGRRPRPRRGLRDIADQVVVITGGSSGIGRETAIRFGLAGAKVVVLARDEARLIDTVALITDRGGSARHIVCDVTDSVAVQAAVAVIEKDFGRIDTWVGNAGAVLYGSLADTGLDELRDLFEVNFIGQVNGIRAALPALRRAGGGAIICVTSAEAVTTLPLHSAYAASKRAVEGALDGLRRELKAERVPVSVTAIRPAVIHTPIYRHARTHMPWAPAAPPPYYHPSVVAKTILYAATHPVRIIHAGGGGRLLILAQALAPALVDSVLSHVGIAFMRTHDRVGPQQGNLRRSVGDDGPAHGLPRPGRRWSLYTWFAIHPATRRTAMAGALALGFLTFRRLRRPSIATLLRR